MNKNDILVIPDIHADPDFPNTRADYIRELIEDTKPGTVVSLGDIGDFSSLRSADKGSKTFEGKRYWKDVEATCEFLDRSIPLVGKTLPRTAITLGNHEYRANRLLNNNPELEGTIDVIRDCDLKLYFNDVVAYKDVINVRGILFSHYFPSGVMGKPIGGDYAAKSLIKKNHQSSICGHSHLLDVADVHTGDGRRLFACVGGCYVHPKFVGDWNRDTIRMWWNGVVYLTNVERGYPSAYQFITQKELAKVYGKRQK